MGGKGSGGRRQPREGKRLGRPPVPTVSREVAAEILALKSKPEHKRIKVKRRVPGKHLVEVAEPCGCELCEGWYWTHDPEVPASIRWAARMHYMSLRDKAQFAEAEKLEISDRTVVGEGNAPLRVTIEHIGRRALPAAAKAKPAL